MYRPTMQLLLKRMGEGDIPGMGLIPAPVYDSLNIRNRPLHYTIGENLG